MLFNLALLTACAGLAAGAALDVWVPPITSPDATTVWTIGTQVNVTWCVLLTFLFRMMPIFLLDIGTLPQSPSK